MLTKYFGPSWKTTLVGFVAGVATYFAQMGANLPVDRQGWTSAIIAAALFAMGATAKDSNVSNAPKPVEAKPVEIPPAT